VFGAHWGSHNSYPGPLAAGLEGYLPEKKGLGREGARDECVCVKGVAYPISGYERPS